MEKNLKGGVIAGDCAYSWGKKHLTNVTILVPYEKPKGKKRKRGNDDAGATELSKGQKLYNNALRKTRSRVEHPFGQIKSQWATLKGYFKEEPDELDSLIYFVFGLYNRQLK